MQYPPQIPEVVILVEKQEKQTFSATYGDEVYDMFGFRSVQAWAPSWYTTPPTTTMAFVQQAFTNGFR